MRWRVEQFSLRDEPWFTEDLEAERLATRAAFEECLQVGWEPFAAFVEYLEGGGKVCHYFLRVQVP